MNDRQADSNVYYLPAPAGAVPVPAAPPTRFVRRLRHAWWRLRLALAEIRAILRRPRPPARLGPLEPDGPVEPAVARRRPVGPARVIDFEVARLRRRPGLEVGRAAPADAAP